MKPKGRLSEACSAFVQTPKVQDSEALARAAAEQFPYHGFIFRELAELGEELRLREVKVVSFHPSNLSPLLDLLPSPDIFVAGDLAVNWALLQSLGAENLIAGSYPRALHHLLHRRTWQATRRELAASGEVNTWPVFVKPCSFRIFDNVRFRGRIIETPNALDSLHSSLSNEPFFCSEVVGWLSEYRCYVLHSRILGIHPYRVAGVPVYRVACAQLEALAPELRPAENFVQVAIQRLDDAGQSVAGYCLDFGLSTLGEMSLIEMNDGLALLNYGISAADHLDLHMARWRELMEVCASDASADRRRPD